MFLESNEPDLKERESVVREKFQITLPSIIRNRAQLSIGDVLIWDYDENTKTMIAIARPKSFTKALSGRGKHLWKNGTAELDRERSQEWDD